MALSFKFKQRKVSCANFYNDDSCSSPHKCEEFSKKNYGTVKKNNTIFSVETIFTQMLFYAIIAKYYIAMHICIFVVFGHILNLRSSNLVSHTTGRYRSII